MNLQFIQQYKEQKIQLEGKIKTQGELLKNQVVNSRLESVIVAPIIYSMIVPLTILDLTVFLYQHSCFRIYGIPIVKREYYFIIDRYHLSYLNGMQKVNCVYCGYANGLAAYAKEVIARTEEYWCPIKHASEVKDPHSRYENFSDYDNPEEYRNNKERCSR